MDQRVSQVWGQSFGNGTASQMWLFIGFDDAAAVDGRIKQFLPGEIPLVWAGLPLDTSWQVDEKGGGVWTVKASFTSRAGSITDPAGSGQYPQHGGDEGADQELPANISYGISRGTQHINQSYETLQSATVGAFDAPDHKRAIGVQGDGKIDGCDIPAGEVTWTLRARLPAALVTGAYVAHIERLCSPNPKLNDAPFFGFKKGELLIANARIGEASSNGFRSAEFEFAVKRDQAELVISDDPVLKLTNVGGWSFVWCYYRTEATDVGGGVRRSVIRPVDVYEERIFEYGDFTALSIDKFKKIVL